MKAIFLGRKPYSCKALEYLIQHNINILAVVAIPESKEVHWQPRLCNIAAKLNIPLFTDKDLYKILVGEKIHEKIDLSDVDLVISYLYWERIKKPLIELPKIGCINFHPAPLPELRGLGGYNIAIYDRMKYYGVSAHFVEENFDSGDLIQVNKFSINPEKETAYSLEQKSQKEMYKLFTEVIDLIVSRKDLPRVKQGKGRYISRDDFNSLRRINLSDSSEEIKRKIRAFWYPPRHGAFIEINGEEYTLLDENTLKEIGKSYHP